MCLLTMDHWNYGANYLADIHKLRWTVGNKIVLKRNESLITCTCRKKRSFCHREELHINYVTSIRYSILEGAYVEYWLIGWKNITISIVTVMFDKDPRNDFAFREVATPLECEEEDKCKGTKLKQKLLFQPRPFWFDPIVGRNVLFCIAYTP